MFFRLKATIIIIFTIIKHPQSAFCLDQCYVDGFTNGLSSIFNQLCNNRPLFQIREYDSSILEPPNNSNGYYLTPHESNSCVASSISKNFGTDTEISFLYYTSIETTRPSCFWTARVNESVNVVSKLIDVNNDRVWRKETGILNVAGEVSIQLWCSNMNGAILAIDYIRIKELNSDVCVELIQPTTTESTSLYPSTETSMIPSSSEISTSEIITSTTELSTISQLTTDQLPETTINQSSTIDQSTPYPSSEVTPIVTESTSTNISPSNPDNDYDDLQNEMKNWQIIAISALVISIVALLYSLINSVYYRTRKREKPEEDWADNDTSYSWNTSQESAIPRLKVDRRLSKHGSVVIDITSNNNTR